MPISIGSNFDLSIAANTPLAEIQEMGCSLLCPPATIATRIFFIRDQSPLRFESSLS